MHTFQLDLHVLVFFSFRVAQKREGTDFLLKVLHCLKTTFEVSQDDTMFSMEDVELIAMLKFCAKQLGVMFEFQVLHPHLQRYLYVFLRQAPKPMKDIFATSVSIYFYLV